MGQTISAICGNYVDQQSQVLDIGCGTGRITLEIARKGVHFALGIDIAPAMVSYAKQIAETDTYKTIHFNVWRSQSHLVAAHINGWGVHNAAFAVGDAQTLPFKSGGFDMVLCLNVLHRVDDPDVVIMEVERLAKHKGIVVMSNSYDWSEEYCSKSKWFDSFSEKVSAETWSPKLDIDGLMYISEVNLRKYTIAINQVQIFQIFKVGESACEEKQ